MLPIPLSRRSAVSAAYIGATAAVLVAVFTAIGTVTARADDVTVTITNQGTRPISINIEALNDYREDIDAGETKSIPAGNLTGVDPNNTNIQWEARLRDLESTGQERANPVCARGVIIFQGQAGHIDVTKCG
jgi:hypothetical protein